MVQLTPEEYKKSIVHAEIQKSLADTIAAVNRLMREK